MLLANLEASRYADNTIVVIFSDHGWQLGEKEHWRKFALWEEPTRMPLIWVVPGVTNAGGVCSRTVDLMSIYPTLCELADLPIPKHVEGHSFVPLLDQPDRPWKKAAFSQYPRGKTMGYSMRTPTHRLTKWVHRQSGEIREAELYDYSDGLIETKNIAATSPDLKR